MCLLFTTTVATLSLTCTFILTHSPTLTPTSNSSCIKIIATTTTIIIITLSFAGTFIFTPPTLELTCDGSSSIITITTATTTAVSTGVGGGGHGVLRVWVVACCVVIILFF